MSNRADVVEAFLTGRRKKASHFQTDGECVWSYWTLVAVKSKKGTIYAVLPPSQGGWSRSGSTSTHLGALFGALNGRPDVRFVSSPDKLPKRLVKSAPLSRRG